MAHQGHPQAAECAQSCAQSLRARPNLFSPNTTPHPKPQSQSHLQFLQSHSQALPQASQFYSTRAPPQRPNPAQCSSSPPFAPQPLAMHQPPATRLRTQTTNATPHKKSRRDLGCQSSSRNKFHRYRLCTPAPQFAP